MDTLKDPLKTCHQFVLFEMESQKNAIIPGYKSIYFYFILKF